MARFKLDLEYLGTRYSGWQIQRNARTVQGEIAAAVRALSGRTDFELYGAGRTDAGVHALHQVAHLDLNTVLAPAVLRLKLNDTLPADINVLDVVKVARRFHARHDAVGRSYLYQVCRRRTAFGKPFVWWVKDPLDARAMREAAAVLVGRHDFRSFAAADPEEGSTLVQVDAVEIAEADPLLLVRVQGSHFLWRMVRRLVGVLVEAGRGALAPADLGRFLAASSPVPARLTAPPSGLFLERVFYEGDRRDWPLRPAIALGG